MANTIRDIMTIKPRTCTRDQSVMEALKIMRDVDCGAVPVVDESHHVKGIITDRDIALCMLECDKNPRELTIDECEKNYGKVITVQPESSIEDAVALMEKHQIRRLPVCDQDGRCVGIVAQADFAVKIEAPELVEDLVEGISKKKATLGANPNPA